MKNILGTIGKDNYIVKDCPFYMPKENMNFFNMMQAGAAQDPYANYGLYGNAYIRLKGSKNFDQLHK